eukprot:bmy_05672T0
MQVPSVPTQQFPTEDWSAAPTAQATEWFSPKGDRYSRFTQCESHKCVPWQPETYCDSISQNGGNLPFDRDLFDSHPPLSRCLSQFNRIAYSLNAMAVLFIINKLFSVKAHVVKAPKNDTEFIMAQPELQQIFPCHQNNILNSLE